MDVIYQPTEQDAIRAYMVAAAHHYNLPIEALDHSELWRAIQSGKKKGVLSFGIINPNDSGLNEQALPPVAICTYQFDNTQWKVTLSPHSDRISLLLAFVDGSLTVVEP